MYWFGRQAHSLDAICWTNPIVRLCDAMPSSALLQPYIYLIYFFNRHHWTWILFENVRKWSIHTKTLNFFSFGGNFELQINQRALWKMPWTHSWSHGMNITISIHGVMPSFSSQILVQSKNLAKIWWPG